MYVCVGGGVVGVRVSVYLHESTRDEVCVLWVVGV